MKLSTLYNFPYSCNSGLERFTGFVEFNTRDTPAWPLLLDNLHVLSSPCFYVSTMHQLDPGRGETNVYILGDGCLDLRTRAPIPSYLIHFTSCLCHYTYRVRDGKGPTRA